MAARPTWIPGPSLRTLLKPSPPAAHRVGRRLDSLAQPSPPTTQLPPVAQPRSLPSWVKVTVTTLGALVVAGRPLVMTSVW